MAKAIEERLGDLWLTLRSKSLQREALAAEIASDLYSLCIEQVTSAELGMRVYVCMYVCMYVCILYIPMHIHIYMSSCSDRFIINYICINGSTL